MKLINLIILLFSISNLSAKEIMIKYSVNDCVLCNLKLKEFSPKNSDKIYVVFKESTDDEQIDEVKKTYKDFSFLKSDSMFYHFDSSERSVLYVYEGDNILYKEYLKLASRQAVEKILVASGHIVSKSLAEMVSSNNYLYAVEDSKNYILKIDKHNLLTVFDTVFIDNKAIEKVLYQSHYGIHANEKLENSKLLAAKYEIIDRTNFRNVQVVNDTIYCLASTNMIYMEAQDAIRVSSLLSIIALKNGYIVNSYNVDFVKTIRSEQSKELLTVSSDFFYIDKGNFYLSVSKNDIGAYNPMLCKAKLKGKDLLPVRIMDYELPETVTDSKIGYMMSQMSFNTGLANNFYSSKLYDIDRHVTYNLGINDRFIYDKDAFLDLKVNINYATLGYYKDRDTLYYIYNINDTTVLSTFLIKKGGVQKIASKVINDQTAGNARPGLLVCDKQGFYVYNKRQRAIIFHNYNEFSKDYK